MDAYNATNWTALFGAEVSAAAALTGLIFVAVSINLGRILQYAALPRRVLRALFMLVYALVISTIMLVPGQPTRLLGLELVLLGLAAVVSIVVLDVSTWRVTEPEYRRGLLPMLAIGLGSGLTTAVGGMSLLVHSGGGVYWLVPAVLLAFIAALVEAWVLLIEIVR